MRFRWIGLFILALILVIVPIQASAQAVVWTASYYNNPHLLGSVAVQRTETAISFDWGNGSPAPEINPDNFSVRWTTDLYFTAGTYRFYALADDNVRITIDNLPTSLIDTFNQPAVGQVVTADTILAAGNHHLQVDYREWGGSAYVYVNWNDINAAAPNIPVSPPLTNVGVGSWTAQYYTNAGLLGSPALILAESTPSHNWGAGAPAANLPADNFSVRWTSSQILNTGNYQLTARADGGVRVFVDGNLYINEWHLASGNPYSVNVALAAGQHNFMVEYFEAAGVAYLDFGIRHIGTIPSNVVFPPTGTNVTGTVVTAVRLNVRSAPSVNAPILTKINQNETYPVLGRNADSTWWQINVNGTVGWVYWRFLDVSNPSVVSAVSASESPTNNQPTPTGYTVSTLATVNVRSNPSTQGAILGQIAPGGTAPVVSRTSAGNWFQVNFQQITGWVNARWVRLQPTANINNIPVTG